MPGTTLSAGCRVKASYGGRLVLDRLAGEWRYQGGATVLHCIPWDSCYSSLVYALNEKLRHGPPVSITYQLPGEELHPDGLITVADDQDVLNMLEAAAECKARNGRPAVLRILLTPACYEDSLTEEEYEAFCEADSRGGSHGAALASSHSSVSAQAGFGQAAAQHWQKGQAPSKCSPYGRQQGTLDSSYVTQDQQPGLSRELSARLAHVTACLPSHISVFGDALAAAGLSRLAGPRHPPPGPQQGPVWSPVSAPRSAGPHDSEAEGLLQEVALVVAGNALTTLGCPEAMSEGPPAEGTPPPPGAGPAWDQPQEGTPPGARLSVHSVPRASIQVLRRLGEGAFGDVCLARCPTFGPVAVKWLKPAKQERYGAAFWREAATLSGLNHPNVLRFFGVAVEAPADPTVVGIITEHCRGGSLSQLLRSDIGFIPLRQRAELALHLANGMAYLHSRGVVHFDLKPDNLLLDAPYGSEGRVPVLKVADFGLSKHKTANYVTGVCDLRGTLAYMAPELISDPEHVSEKADVWSLGLVLWELLCLEPPFQHLTPQQIIAGLMVGNLQLDPTVYCEPEWHAVVSRCLQMQPAERASFEEVAAHLECLLSSC